MSRTSLVITTFDNEFDITENELNSLTIKENNLKDNCFIWESSDATKAYSTFVLSKNSKSKTICSITFYKSSHTGRYIPRPTFKRLKLTGEEQTTVQNINISFNTSTEAGVFWKFIGFLSSYKDLVDLGDFQKFFKVVPKESYTIEFKDKNTRDKVEDLK